MRFSNVLSATHFWQTVGECTVLNGFRVETDTQDWDEYSSPDMVRQALVGKHISTIGLMGVGRITSEDVVTILDGLPADEFVRCLEIDSEVSSILVMVRNMKCVLLTASLSVMVCCIGVIGVGGRQHPGGPQGGGEYLPYHSFLRERFWRKKSKKFRHYVTKTFFSAEGPFYPVLVQPPSAGGG